MTALRRTALGIVGTLICGCTSGRVPVYVAPTNDTVEAGTEMSLGGDGQYVFVFNHSTVTIVVTSLILRECENIKNRCEVVRLRTPVRPGQRQNLTLVKPDNTSLPYSFRFSYSWEASREP